MLLSGTLVKRSRLPKFGSCRIALAASCMFLSMRANGHELEKPIPIQEFAPSWPSGVSTERDVVVPVILTISAEGIVTEVQVEASLGADFDDAAIAAARRWTFEPARHDGLAVASRVRAVVRFRGTPQPPADLTVPLALGSSEPRDAESAATEPLQIDLAFVRDQSNGNFNSAGRARDAPRSRRRRTQ